MCTISTNTRIFPLLFILNLKCHLSRCFMAVGQPNIGKIANVYHFHQHSVFSIDNQPDPNPIQ